MPAPRKRESLKHYLDRAIPAMMKEGLTQKQAVGKAEGWYHGKKKSGKKGK